MMTIFYVMILNIFLILTSVKSLADAGDFLPVNGSKFDAVARIPLYKEDKFLGYCSGSLITKDKVLTARHCLENKSIPFVILGNSGLHEAIKVLRVSTMDMPKKINNMFDENDKASEKYMKQYYQALADDLVLLHLEKTSKFEPLEILPMEKWTSLNSFPLRIVGYPAIFAQYVAASFGGQIPKAMSNLGTCRIEKYSPNQSVYSTDCLAVGGNSGGPVFTEINSKVYIVGMTSTSDHNGIEKENFLGKNFEDTKFVSLLNESVLRWVL